MAKKTYTIPFQNGTTHVVTMSAVVGDEVFGVHRSIDRKKGWTLTHLPTGLKLAYLDLKRTAVGCAENLLQEVPDVDWSLADGDEMVGRYGRYLNGAAYIVKCWEDGRATEPITAKQAKTWAENRNPLG